LLAAGILKPPHWKQTADMIDFTDCNEDLEKTQQLPILTPDLQLDEALQRERAARIEIVELMRQNLRQANEIERLHNRHTGDLLPNASKFSSAVERNITTEEKLFEVCGALKDTLSNVLKECQTRNLSLNCGSSARRALEDSCEKLEQILSAPGFWAPHARGAEVAQKTPLAKAAQMVEPMLRSISVMPVRKLVPSEERSPARIPRLEVLKSEVKPRTT
jgi:hypothetical protein